MLTILSQFSHALEEIQDRIVRPVNIDRQTALHCKLMLPLAWRCICESQFRRFGRVMEQLDELVTSLSSGTIFFWISNCCCRWHVRLTSASFGSNSFSRSFSAFFSVNLGLQLLVRLIRRVEIH